MTAPYVSIVVPIYNAEKHLEKSLTSVMTQSLENIEIICVDDGSLDSSCDLVSRQASADSRIKLMRQGNAGAGVARNVGVAAAQGRFVTFLDADDWYSSNNYLSRLYEGACETNQLVAAASFANYRGPDDTEADFSASPYYEGYSFGQSGVVRYEDYQFDYGFHRFMFSRDLFDSGVSGFPSLTFYEDPVFLVRILHRAGSFYAAKEAEYRYRCKTKAGHWHTKKLVDLLEGVRLNLQFSHDHGLAKLHWYTAHHLDAESDDVGIGVNRRLDLSVIAEKLAQVEASLDPQMLCGIDPTDEGFMFGLREKLDSCGSYGLLRTIRGSIGYALRHE